MNDSITPDKSQINPKQSQFIIGSIIRFSLGGMLLLVVLFVLGLGVIRLWAGPQLENILTDSRKLNNLLPAAIVANNIRVNIDFAKVDWGEWLSPSLILKGIAVNKDSDLELLEITKLESKLGLNSLIKFLQKKPITADVVIDEASIFIGKKQLNQENKFFMLSLPLLLSDHKNNYFRFSTNQVEIEKLKLLYDKHTANEKNEYKFLNLGNVKIKNKPSGLEVLFKEFTANSLLSVVSLTGNLPEDYAKFQGSVNSLIFKLPKNNNKTREDYKSSLNSIIIEAKFENLGVIETEKGFTGLHGSFLFNSSGIDFNFFSKDAKLFLPDIFPVSNFQFSNIFGRVSMEPIGFKNFLTGKYKELPIKIHELNLANSELNIKSRGLWVLDAEGNERVDLKGEASFFKSEALSNYLPNKISKKTRNWLERGVKSVDSVEGSFAYEGPIKKIPDLSGENPINFEARLEVKNLDLLFSSKWPLVKKINAEIEFKNSSFSIMNASGLLGESKLMFVEGAIPDIFSTGPELYLNGEVSGSLQNFINVSNDSPIQKWLWGITESAVGSGQTHLDLSLILDLKKIKKSEFNGQLRFKDASFRFRENYLPIENIEGEINFSEKFLSQFNIQSEILGGKVNFVNSSLTSFKTGLHLKADGVLNPVRLESWLNNSFNINIQNKILGNSNYEADIKLSKGKVDFQLKTDLRGTQLDIPKPFGKSFKESRNLKLKFSHLSTAIEKGWKRILDVRSDNGLMVLINQVSEDSISEDYKSAKDSKFVIMMDENNSQDVADDLFNQLPTQSFNKIVLNQSNLNIKSWLDFAKDLNNVPQKSYFEKLKGNPLQFKIHADDLKIGNNRFSNFSLQTLATVNGLSGIFNSAQATGVFNWSKDANRVSAHLTHYHQNNSIEKNKFEGFELKKYISFEDNNNWPELNVFVDDFRSINFQGKLAFDAEYITTQKIYNISRIEIFSENIRLDARGFWRKSNTNFSSKIGVDDTLSSETTTEIDFRVEAKNGANLLEDFGYPGLLAGSGGIISGQLKWLGSPLDFGVKNSSGNLSLNIGKGKFLKVEPGLARLIGVLNLQSFTRRIKLDFEDIFSEGFSFDKLRGNVSLENGIASTTNLRVIGTQASVFLEGNVGLLDQTQDMRILVLPELNAGLASLGYVLVNPAIGLGSFLAQYILRDPLRKILAYEYKLKGSWDSPLVESITRSRPLNDKTSIYTNSPEKD